MKDRGSFFEAYRRIKVEGFEQQKLLSQALKAGIVLRNVRVKSDIEMTMDVMEYDWDSFMKLVRSRYRVSLVHERGVLPLLRRVLSYKTTLAGLALFAVLMLYQSSFVSEIQIYGYERLREVEIRQELKAAGLYEGCSKSVDLDHIEAQMYGKLDNISYIGIKYVGNMAEVTLVEGTGKPQVIDDTTPCHIVADKEGYLERIIPKEGFPVLEKGMYVKPGDVVISGVVPVEDRTNGTTSYRNVHADGEVYGSVLYRSTAYQDRYQLIKKPTGRKTYGIELRLGTFQWNSTEAFWRYDSSVRTEKKLFSLLRPVPIRLSLVRDSEVELFRRERSQEEIRKAADTQAREQIRKTIPESAQILNKSLKFTPEENIIEVTIMLQALEEIGSPKTFDAVSSGAAITGPGLGIEGGT